MTVSTPSDFFNDNLFTGKAGSWYWTGPDTRWPPGGRRLHRGLSKCQPWVASGVRGWSPWPSFRSTGWLNFRSKITGFAWCKASHWYLLILRPAIMAFYFILIIFFFFDYFILFVIIFLILIPHVTHVLLSICMCIYLRLYVYMYIYRYISEEHVVINYNKCIWPAHNYQGSETL